MQRRQFIASAASLAVSGALADVTSPAAPAPDEWIDPETGHRVRRLSRREGSNSAFYFHQNPFTADGDKMVFMGTTTAGRRGFTVDLDSLGIRQITFDRNSNSEVVAPRRREFFYRSGDTIYATHVDTAATREIATVPADWWPGGFSVNADETLLLGFYAEGVAEYFKRPRSRWFGEIFDAKLPNALYTIEIEAGQVNVFYRENAWLGHVQFSPTDPTQLMFCHEGPWHLLERIRLVRTDGSELRKVHERTVEGEIAGHEFWHPDGRHVWFDLRIPQQGIYIARADIETGEEVRLPLAEEQWSYHYNVSADGKLLCGDGGNKGKFIYLYVPEEDGVRVQRLCSLAGHDYKLEPNVRFTPDGRWVVFRSNMHGASQVYGVEVRRAG